MGTTRTVNEATGEVIDQERFTKTVDHQVVVERTTWLLEHRPIQKKYVMETRLVGERGVEGKPTEIIGPVQSRIVEDHTVGMPVGEKPIVLEGVDLPTKGESATSRITLPTTANTIVQDTSNLRSRIGHMLNTEVARKPGSDIFGSHISQRRSSASRDEQVPHLAAS